MTATREKLKAMIDVAKAATPGPWKLFSKFSVTEVQQDDDTPVVSWLGFDAVKGAKEKAAHIAQANPTAVIALCEGALELVEALEYCASNDSMAVDPDGKYDHSSADHWKKMKAEEALRKFAGRMEGV